MSDKNDGIVDGGAIRRKRDPSVLAGGIKELHQNERLTDCIFIAEGGQRVKCHQCILVCSPVLKALFNNTEIRLGGHIPVLSIPDFHHESIHKLLLFLYVGEVSLKKGSRTLIEFKELCNILKINPPVNKYRSSDPKTTTTTMMEVEKKQDHVQVEKRDSMKKRDKKKDDEDENDVEDENDKKTSEETPSVINIPCEHCDRVFAEKSDYVEHSIICKFRDAKIPAERDEHTDFIDQSFKMPDNFDLPDEIIQSSSKPSYAIEDPTSYKRSHVQENEVDSTNSPIKDNKFIKQDDEEEEDDDGNNNNNNKNNSSDSDSFEDLLLAVQNQCDESIKNNTLPKKNKSKLIDDLFGDEETPPLPINASTSSSTPLTLPPPTTTNPTTTTEAAPPKKVGDSKTMFVETPKKSPESSKTSSAETHKKSFSHLHKNPKVAKPDSSSSEVKKKKKMYGNEFVYGSSSSSLSTSSSSSSTTPPKHPLKTTSDSKSVVDELDEKRKRTISRLKSQESSSIEQQQQQKSKLSPSTSKWIVSSSNEEEEEEEEPILEGSEGLTLSSSSSSEEEEQEEELPEYLKGSLTAEKLEAKRRQRQLHRQGRRHHHHHRRRRRRHHRHQQRQKEEQIEKRGKSVDENDGESSSKCNPNEDDQTSSRQARLLERREREGLGWMVRGNGRKVKVNVQLDGKENFIEYATYKLRLLCGSDEESSSDDEAVPSRLRRVRKRDPSSYEDTKWDKLKLKRLERSKSMHEIKSIIDSKAKTVVEGNTSNKRSVSEMSSSSSSSSLAETPSKKSLKLTDLHKPKPQSASIFGSSNPFTFNYGLSTENKLLAERRKSEAVVALSKLSFKKKPNSESSTSSSSSSSSKEISES